MKSATVLNGRHELTVYNKLPRNHPRRRTIEMAIRKAFSGLGGRWSVVVQLSSRVSLLVVVLAPDRSAWVIDCGNSEHWNAETLGGTVTAVCRRRGWVGVAPARHSNGTDKPVGAPADSGATKGAVSGKKERGRRGRVAPRPR